MIEIRPEFFTEDLTVPESHPFAAQIEAIGQLPVEITQDLAQLQAYIATTLQETDPGSIGEIGKTIEAISSDNALRLLIKALKKEGEGGMLVYDKSRQRTLGGLYFLFFRNIIHLSKPKVPPESRLPFEWDKRAALIESAMSEVGAANSVKLTLVGRPSKVAEKGEVVLIAMLPKPAPKDVPKDLPKLKETPTTPNIVYVVARQWQKVKMALANSEDELILAGHPIYSPQLKTIALFASQTTTKLQEKMRKRGEWCLAY